jgi:hypothetical protein
VANAKHGYRVLLFVRFAEYWRDADTSSPLKTALDAFENALSPNQKAQLLSFSSILGSSEVLAFTKQLYDADDARQSRRIADKLSGFLESVMQFSSAIDTFVQVEQNISSLVWGSVKVVMLVCSFFSFPNGPVTSC